MSKARRVCCSSLARQTSLPQVVARTGRKEPTQSMRFIFKREHKVVTGPHMRLETDYLRPRCNKAASEGANLKGLITVSPKEGQVKGHICWGIVDSKDEFVASNQQLHFDPWTGTALPLTVDELKAVIRAAR